MEQKEDDKIENPEAAPDEASAEDGGAAAGEDPKADGAGTEEGNAESGDEKPDTPDWKDRYARVMADFDNFRKRTARDREDLVKFAASDVIRDLLATADTLALALSKAEKADDPFVKGVQMAYDAFLKALADHGATPFDSVGEPFDANFHEAIAQLPSDTVEEGRVSAEAKRGWLMNGKLLRAAQVVVSAGKPGGADKADAESKKKEEPAA